MTYLKEVVLVNLFGIDILFLRTLMTPTMIFPILPMTVLVYRVLLVPMPLPWMMKMMLLLVSAA